MVMIELNFYKLGEIVSKFFRRYYIIKLSAPKVVVFWIAVILAVVALLMALGVFSLGFISAVWVALIAFVLLLLGNVLKGF